MAQGSATAIAGRMGEVKAPEPTAATRVSFCAVWGMVAGMGVFRASVDAPMTGLATATMMQGVESVPAKDIVKDTEIMDAPKDPVAVDMGGVCGTCMTSPLAASGPLTRPPQRKKHRKGTICPEYRDSPGNSFARASIEKILQGGCFQPSDFALLGQKNYLETAPGAD